MYFKGYLLTFYLVGLVSLFHVLFSSLVTLAVNRFSIGICFRLVTQFVRIELAFMIIVRVSEGDRSTFLLNVDILKPIWRVHNLRRPCWSVESENKCQNSILVKSWAEIGKFWYMITYLIICAICRKKLLEFYGYCYQIFKIIEYFWF